MEENEVKWEAFFEQNKIDFNDLDEKVQMKISSFDKLYGEYSETEEGSNEEAEISAKLEALDMGILTDLQSYVGKKKQEEAAQPQQVAAQGAVTATQTPEPSNDNNSEDTPSWRFWM